MSVHVTEAKFLLLEVSTTTLSPSIWHLKSVYITEAKFILLEVSTTTLSPSGWQIDVSTHPLGQVSTVRGQFYYIKSQYLTHIVSTHHWGQGFTARGHYYYIDSQFLTPWSQYTWLRQRFLLLEVCTTTLSPSIYHMQLVHITEAKLLLLKVSITTLSHNSWRSTHHWDQEYTARGQDYYIESQYLTPRCQYTWLRQSFYCLRSVLLHWVPVSDNLSKYLSLSASFYC